MNGTTSISDPSVNTAFATISFPTGSSCGGVISLTITATDGTNYATGTASVPFSAQRSPAGVSICINGTGTTNTSNLQVSDVMHDDVDPGRGGMWFNVTDDTANDKLILSARPAVANFTPTSGTIYWDVNEVTGATVLDA